VYLLTETIIYNCTTL